MLGTAVRMCGCSEIAAHSKPIESIRLQRIESGRLCSALAAMEINSYFLGTRKEMPSSDDSQSQSRKIHRTTRPECCPLAGFLESTRSVCQSSKSVDGSESAGESYAAHGAIE